MEKNTTNIDIQKELHLLEREQKKVINDIKNSNNSIIQEIKSFNRENVSNTIYVDKKYTLWQRVKKVLGMS